MYVLTKTSAQTPSKMNGPVCYKLSSESITVKWLRLHITRVYFAYTHLQRVQFSYGCTQMIEICSSGYISYTVGLISSPDHYNIVWIVQLHWCDLFPKWRLKINQGNIHHHISSPLLHVRVGWFTGPCFQVPEASQAFPVKETFARRWNLFREFDVWERPHDSDFLSVDQAKWGQEGLPFGSLSGWDIEKGTYVGRESFSWLN